MRELKEGFEVEFESLMAKRENLEVEKSKAREEAIRKVDEKFEERSNTITSLLNLISIEIPDKEVVHETRDRAEPCETESLPEESGLGEVNLGGN